MRVGIAWRGNPRNRADRRRSIQIERFAQLGDIPGLRLFSLQKDDGDAPDDHPDWIETLGPDLDAGPGAFLDTAAVMMSLDLVITCDTALAHLAGALGRPVWVALHFVPDHRWMMDRDDSPWYPTMRLFRQPAPGDWAAVFDEIALAIADFNRGSE